MAGGLGFEPRLAESESAVLPLDDPPPRIIADDNTAAMAWVAGVTNSRFGFVTGCATLSGRVRAGSFVERVRSPRELERPSSAVARPAILLPSTSAPITAGCWSPRPARSGFRIIDAFSRIVRLGEGLAATRRALRGGDGSHPRRACRLRRKDRRSPRPCRPLCCHRGLPPRRQLRAPSASGCATGSALDIEIISTAEEARLVVTGCAPLLDPRMPYAVVFDIGGGSTEIVWVRLTRDRGGLRRGLQILGSVSMPLGVVTLDRPLWRRGLARGLSRHGRRGGRRAPTLRAPPSNRPADRRRPACRCSAARAR